MPPRRLVWPPSPADLERMAVAPSRFAPHPRELLDPAPFVAPGPQDMPSDERLLLDAVLADPDADGPRLAYADWCDRRGDCRGAFIRGQIAQHHHPETPTACPAVRPEWSVPLTPWSVRDIVFRRGFVEALSLTGRAFFSISDGLFRIAPIRDVRLIAVQPYTNEFARAANLARLDRLDLRGNQIGPAGVRHLAATPHLGLLTALDLSRNGLETAGVREVSAAPWRSQLHALALADNHLTAADVRTLLTDPGFATLDDLDLSDNPLGSEGAAVLAESGFLSRAKRLAICSTHLGPAGAAVLAGAVGRPEYLDLGFNALGNEGVAMLAAAPLLATVRQLALRGNRIGPTGAAALVRSDTLKSLSRLDLSVNQLDPRSVAALRERFETVAI
ncbi:TIGR02996 domain-containing protein [Fimbriiglobus ruber]|uniref:GalA protein type 1 n=1 Tax=Fimbriiglobus ruber TaxID=1908690 RepID=A0A225DGE6_9BACT|nr:TIGR02996 domain-containing protein [Fimbriiglobus ruber]OWK36426.1 GalA protein type 1 [Fimbriiglobus ruber]